MTDALFHAYVRDSGTAVVRPDTPQVLHGKPDTVIKIVRALVQYSFQIPEVQSIYTSRDRLRELISYYVPSYELSDTSTGYIQSSREALLDISSSPSPSYHRTYGIEHRDGEKFYYPFLKASDLVFSFKGADREENVLVHPLEPDDLCIALFEASSSIRDASLRMRKVQELALALEIEYRFRET